MLTKDNNHFVKSEIAHLIKKNDNHLLETRSRITINDSREILTYCAALLIQKRLAHSSQVKVLYDQATDLSIFQIHTTIPLNLTIIKEINTEDIITVDYPDHKLDLSIFPLVDQKHYQYTLKIYGEYFHFHNQNIEEDKINFIVIELSSTKDKDSNQFISEIRAIFGKNEQEISLKQLQLNELMKGDHRYLGKQMNLFHFEKESPGIPFFHPNGYTLWRLIENYIRQVNDKYLYREIKTPLLANIDLWQKSGHADKYTDGMYKTSYEEREYVIRPMNCPTSIQVFKKMNLSYRDLPIRLSEFGIVHRNEPSGSLNGLFRSRSFTQDDAHIFCLEKHLVNEITMILKQCEEIYSFFGFQQSSLTFKLATRPDQYIGEMTSWIEAEKYLEESLNQQNIPWQIAKKEGAFYGPKIEIHLQDKVQRTWQCGTIQLDFSMTERLNAYYIDKDGAKQYPLLIHRAILGSFERFIGILLEHYQGKLPLQFMPIQMVICTINETLSSYAQKQASLLSSIGIRISLDNRQETLSSKIRDANLNYIPIIGIIGENEYKTNSITLRIGNDIKKCLSIEEIKTIIISLIRRSP
jgi:threonyl-tRNA synthetase